MTQPEPESSGSAVVRTLLLTDLIDSVGLVTRLGDAAVSEVGLRHERLARDLLVPFGGREIDKTDGFLLLFERPVDAVSYALAYHQGLAELAAEIGVPLAARAGVHLGEVFLRANDPDDVARGAKPLEVEGLAKATAARLMALARGGQTLVTRGAFDLARRATVGAEMAQLRWLAHGPYLLQGVDEPVEVFEVGIEGRSPLAAPPDTAKARRAVPAGDEITLGWRPAAGQEIEHRPHWVLREKRGEGGFGEVWLAVHAKTGEQRVFKFCHRADRLRALRREVTVFRLLRETLGQRPDIARILDWNFDEAPYFLEAEYTEGGSLVEWAAAQGGLEEVPLATRLELMAQVAEALDAAHSVGVLHKDVKPANVLVAPGPRAVLTDFGIGLITDREALAAQGITVAGFTEMKSLSTLGSFSGTQLYMAPELMEGKPPTVRADLYALGMMIYQVVVGDLTRALAPGWDRDVGDELLRDDLAEFLDHAPERRPRSALEIAERLQNLDARRAARQAERRAREEALRAQRRRKVLAVTSAVATVFLVVVSVLAIHAFRDRQEAELRRSQAEGLLSYLIDDLQTRLQPIGRLELLEDVGERALAHFNAVPEGRLNDVEQTYRVRALSLLGKVRMERGDLPAAKATFEEALGVIEAMLARDPDRSEWRREQGGLHFRIGEVLWNQRDFEGAEGHFQRFLEIAAQEAASAPDDPEWQNMLAYSRTNAGWIRKARGDLDGALRYFRSALAVNERLAAENPDHLVYQRNLAVNYNAIASVLEERGELKEALELYRADLDIKRKLVELDPENRQRQADLSTSHNLVGQVLERLGDRPASLEHYRAAVVVLERLVAEDPTNATWLRNLAVNELRVGQALLALGKPEDALSRFRSTRDATESLVAKDSSKVSWQRELARSNLAMGEALLVLGRKGEALTHADKAVAMLESLSEGYPSDRSLARWLGSSYLLLGRTRAAHGLADGAEMAWTRAREILEPLARGSEDADLLDPWVRSLLYLGLVDEARATVRRLADMGYADAEFLDLCRRKGAL